MADTSRLAAAVRARAAQRMEAAAQQLVDVMRSRASRRSGALADGIHIESVTDDGVRILVRVVSTAPYSRYQDEGTGVYGPEGRRIQGNPLLAFDWPAAGGLVIVHSVAGSPGTHFWTEGLKQWPDILRAA